jgi:hypothetical protein
MQDSQKHHNISPKNGSLYWREILERTWLIPKICKIEFQKYLLIGCLGTTILTKIPQFSPEKTAGYCGEHNFYRKICKNLFHNFRKTP